MLAADWLVAWENSWPSSLQYWIQDGVVDCPADLTVSVQVVHRPPVHADITGAGQRSLELLDHARSQGSCHCRPSARHQAQWLPRLLPSPAQPPTRRTTCHACRPASPPARWHCYLLPLAGGFGLKSTVEGTFACDCMLGAMMLLCSNSMCLEMVHQHNVSTWWCCNHRRAPARGGQRSRAAGMRRCRSPSSCPGCSHPGEGFRASGFVV